MKKGSMIVLSSLLLLSLPMWGGSRLNNESLAQSTSHEVFGQGTRKQVVLIVCETWLAKEPIMTVLASSRSEGAPDIPLGIECADAISTVLSAGFGMQHVTDIYGLRVHYIFIRQSQKW
jgi:hypothetical protein